LWWFGVDGYQVPFASNGAVAAQEAADKDNTPTILVDPKDIETGKASILPDHYNYATGHRIIEEKFGDGFDLVLIKISSVVETGIFKEVINESNWVGLDVRHLVPHFNPNIKIFYPQKKRV
jgi:hypothetical protein